jgi:hypothetical protein
MLTSLRIVFSSMLHAASIARAIDASAEATHPDRLALMSVLPGSGRDGRRRARSSSDATPRGASPERRQSVTDCAPSAA